MRAHRRMRFATAAILLALLIPNSASATVPAKGSTLPLVHAGYLTVGSDTTYPPMESTDVQHPGQYIGADVDLANALAHAMGLKGARIVSTIFDSIIPSLKRGNFDLIMSSMNDTPTRRQQITFVDYMRLNASQVILVNKTSSLHANDYSALCGHSITVQSGTLEADGLKAANKACKQKIDVKIFTKDTDAFQAFAAGHAESYTTDLPVGLYYIKQHPTAIRLAGKAFGTGGYYGIGLLKHATALQVAVRHALQTIRKNGQYKAILTRYNLASTAF